MASIRVRGARAHNLKNVDIDLPRNALVVVTGPSGSGKSSLAFDTIFAEGQRRYVESLSAYARQFLAQMEKPDLDHIEGLSPAIAIEQKSTSHNPRSTVGTITEIHDYLRLLFARIGTPHCPEHGEPLTAQTVSQMVDTILEQPEGSRLMLLAPIIKDRKGEHVQALESLRQQGYLRARVDGEVVELDGTLPTLDGRRRHSVDAVVDRFRVRQDLRLRLAESIETALALSEGTVEVASMDDDSLALEFSSTFSCPRCGFAVAELEPRLFSFNSPHGACTQCDGLGVEQFFDPARVVADPTLSIAEGAVRGWDKKTGYFYQQMQSLATHYGFDLDTPFAELGDAVQHRILYGSDGEEITFRYVNDRGDKRDRTDTFEGVINTLARRYRETSSTPVREELAKLQAKRVCDSCGGSRLNASARHVTIGELNLPALADLPIDLARARLASLALTGQRAQVSEKILRELDQRLGFLVDVGLDYLNLARGADTLSGGEAQRIRLASQIGAGLSGVMYVLDEPSIGLHQRDNDRLLATLSRLRDLDNTVIVVEHDEDAIRHADHIVDMGPAAGVHGGEVVASGTLDELLQHDTLTTQYLSGQREIAPPAKRRKGTGDRLTLSGANGNNLKDVSIDIPLGTLCCITGVSGSGKSTLINDTLLRAVAQHLHRARRTPAPYATLEGLDALDKVIAIDQSPIGRTPRSNPATYTGAFNLIRDLFSGTQEARSRGYGPGRFSFNVKGGRCEACQGDGVIRVEMHFLPDVYVPCDACRGARYNRETLDILYRGKSIADVLGMTIEDASALFDPVPQIKRKLDTLLDVGLGYLTLGQSATTLSGGEAQRVKLARELSRRDTGRTLYILDEPTTGLHFHDVAQLMAVLQQLTARDNSVVVIEHNLDVIACADWIIDLGPEGGDKGGTVVAAGTPDAVAKVKRSHTGQYLKRQRAARRKRAKAG
ncbi:MAG: excinuclease ABC subunit UvrA [Pseudomonadota bacterium]